jgi:hypothetical protein
MVKRFLRDGNFQTPTRGKGTGFNQFCNFHSITLREMHAISGPVKSTHETRDYDTKKGIVSRKVLHLCKNGDRFMITEVYRITKKDRTTDQGMSIGWKLETNAESIPL